MDVMIKWIFKLSIWTLFCPWISLKAIHTKNSVFYQSTCRAVIYYFEHEIVEQLTLQTRSIQFNCELAALLTGFLFWFIQKHYFVGYFECSNDIGR